MGCVPSICILGFILVWEVLIIYLVTEIPRVFWALGILFIYLLWGWERDTRSSGF